MRRTSKTKHPKRSIVAIPVVALFAIAALTFSALPRGPAAAVEIGRACQTAGTWLEPGSGKTFRADELFRATAGRKIVLLGESHDKIEDHRWQLHTLAALHAHNSNLVIGFEMFPRAVQPALDDWSQGRTAEGAFLKAARWQQVWGYDPALYLPLFHFARQNRLPMVALNVDRELVSRVGEQGWGAIPEETREGLSDPAPASEAYQRGLAEIYAAKLKRGVRSATRQSADPASGDEAQTAPELSAILASDGFERFVEAQLTWDRAMAEALAAAHKANPDALVVGILGRGHVEHGYGVPHQLADLGIDDIATLLPTEAGSDCEALEAQIADAVFVVASEPRQAASPAKPRLGIMIEQADDGVRILSVSEGSVAEAAGLAAGDIIVRAATFPVRRVSELVEIVQRQAPGTWLPLELERDGETRRLVAEFPSRFQ